MGLSAKQKKEMAERDARVIELRARGLSFEQIARANIDGVGDKQQAHRCFKRGIRNITAIRADDWRKLENEKLDVLERKLHGILGAQTTTTNAQIKTAATLLQLHRQRAILNGLNVETGNNTAGGVQTVFVDTNVLTKSIGVDTTHDPAN